VISVRDNEGFLGVFLQEDAAMGTVLFRLAEDVQLPEPTRTSIRVGACHIEDEVGQYINHSCSPTCQILGFEIVALRDLKRGDEITFDYISHEGELSSPFKCRDCGELLERPPSPCRHKAKP